MNIIPLIWTLKERMMNIGLKRERTMGEACEAPRRDFRGRFVPGQSGNPAGKQPGTRNRATMLREALADGEDATVARIVIDKALAGDAVAARFIVDRLTPRPRGREIELDLPEGSSAADILTASNATIQAMAAGEITPDEALMVTRILDFRLKALAAAAREREISREPSPLHEQEPSPACGRGQGEGLGAPAEQDRRGPGAQPSALPSPVNGRGSFDAARGGRMMAESPAFRLICCL
jgi:Family of unknown function (DUF5681)